MTTRRVAVLVALIAGCSGTPRQFPVRAPLRVDPDTTPFAPRPKTYVSPEIWDTVDNTAFEPLTRLLSLRGAVRARNATAIDEVADSSWFENRVERLAAGDLEAWARGPCTEPPPDPMGPWTVTSGKPNGANPGFMLEHASGRRFLFKLDRDSPRASAADVIGSRIYHAAGYHVPCNRVAYIDPRTIEIAPTATAANFVGDKVPFTREMLDAALARGLHGPEGTVRGGLSELLSGKPIGPWVDFGTRPDDPNDIIPHEDRRELRGSYIFAALLSHYDAREQNALDIWIETDATGAGFVRHYMIDFGDCLGSMSPWPRVSRRRGHVYELDWSSWFVDAITLGILPRPWRHPQFGPAGATLGYFSSEPFDPEHFRTAYPYGPFTRLTEADAAWGARILAKITPDAIRAMVEEAQISDHVVRDALLSALLGRRDKLLRRFLGSLSPLADAHVTYDGDAAWLCAIDRTIDGGIAAPQSRTFSARRGGSPLDVRRGASAAEWCARLPSSRGEYEVIELSTEAERALRVHLGVLGDRYTVVGVER